LNELLDLPVSGDRLLAGASQERAGALTPPEMPFCLEPLQRLPDGLAAHATDPKGLLGSHRSPHLALSTH